MNKPLQLIAILIMVALVAAAACYVSARMFVPLRPQPGVSGHEWIHKQLGLSPEEQKALEPIESKFAERKGNLSGEIRSANKELAEAIKQDQADSPRVSRAVERIHHAQGELQKATLEHVFEMKGVLTPDQYQKLLNLTADELNEVNGGE